MNLDYALECWCGGTIVYTRTTATCEASEFHDPLATGRPARIKRLYVAGPMTGYADFNYPAFHAAAKALRGEGYEVANPAESTIQDAHYVDFLRKDLRMLLDCQGVAVLDNWWESVGARNEVQVAGVLKMPVHPVEFWLR